MTVNILGIIQVDFMAEWLYLVALDCSGVPNKVDSECMCMFQMI